MRDIIKLRSFYTEYFKNVEKKIVPSTVLHSISMYLPTTSGEHININAVTRDNMPNGSDIGCVVAIHDVPGNDKSYLSLYKPLTKKGIRFLAINLPGFGYSSYDKRLKCTSNERLIFTKKICNELIDSKEKVIFMGLGRGCETAIKITDEYHDKGCIGCVAISPYGIKNEHLRDHTFPYNIIYLLSLIKYFDSHQLKPLLDISK
uniref:Hydrolase_4 domain-containing protein n=1 Tax=Strongyloides venezuelensis TaxID=75913 RepID=A0A0K0FAN2_STRVS